MLLLLWSDFVYITIKLYTNNYSPKWILTHNDEYATTKLMIQKSSKVQKKAKSVLFRTLFILGQISAE